MTIYTMILSLLYRLPPDQCKFILIDPKMLELSVYDDIPHLLAPVVTDAATAVTATSMCGMRARSVITGAPPDYPMVASIMRPGSNRIANLNPFSTLSVAITQRMTGGLTESNVNIATGAVLEALSFGLDRSLAARR